MATHFFIFRNLFEFVLKANANNGFQIIAFKCESGEAKTLNGMPFKLPYAMAVIVIYSSSPFVLHHQFYIFSCVYASCANADEFNYRHVRTTLQAKESRVYYLVNIYKVARVCKNPLRRLSF